MPTNYVTASKFHLFQVEAIMARLAECDRSGIELVVSPDMKRAIKLWLGMYHHDPFWLVYDRKEDPLFSVPVRVDLEEPLWSTRPIKPVAKPEWKVVYEDETTQVRRRA